MYEYTLHTHAIHYTCTQCTNINMVKMHSAHNVPLHIWYTYTCTQCTNTVYTHGIHALNVLEYTHGINAHNVRIHSMFVVVDACYSTYRYFTYPSRGQFRDKGILIPLGVFSIFRIIGSFSC